MSNFSLWVHPYLGWRNPGKLIPGSGDLRTDRLSVVTYDMKKEAFVGEFWIAEVTQSGQLMVDVCRQSEPLDCSNFFHIRDDDHKNKGSRILCRKIFTNGFVTMRLKNEKLKLSFELSFNI